MRRLIVRAWALVLVGSAAVVLASGAWSYLSGEGSASSPFAVDVASGAQCIPLAGVTSSTLAPGSNATTSYDSGTCVIDFGLPRGDVGPPGAAGQNGAPGAQGPTGANGAPGATGPAGSNGQSVTSAAATDCRGTGRPGSYFTAVSGSTWACDGATGAQGPQGAQGATGPQGASGAAGPQGATGAAGATGTAGTNGTNGVSAWEYVDSGANGSGASGGVTSVTASCSAGKKILGGGFYFTNNTSVTFPRTVLSANPDNTTSPQSYFVKVINGAGPVTGWQLHAIAICASAL